MQIYAAQQRSRLGDGGPVDPPVGDCRAIVIHCEARRPRGILRRVVGVIFPGARRDTD